RYKLPYWPNVQSNDTNYTVLFTIFYIMIFKTSVSPVVVVQPNVLVTSSPGKSVTLRCSISHSTANYFSWFKQVPGQAPKCILTVYAHSSQATRYGEFINDTRFEVSKNISSLNLIISKTKPSDVGTYYCGVRDYDLLLFGNGTFLDLKGSESISRSVVQQPVSAPVRPGDNATLQCTIHMETCAGDHSVYWFRHDSEESLPGIIYTYENRSDHCERSSVTGAPTQNCVYNLPKRNISPSDAGTYYCAVATCGEILFGNGTLLDISESTAQSTFPPSVCALLVSNAMCFIVITVLICIMKRRKFEHSTGQVSEVMSNTQVCF
uniref:Ig-like domain-containing protein n=1 Tax=Lepisosteus oculatus TaxID=7918 RepID=W5MY61_LEPOC